MSEFDDLLAQVRSGQAPAQKQPNGTDEYSSLLQQVRQPTDNSVVQATTYNASFDSPDAAAERKRLADQLKEKAGEDWSPSAIDPSESKRRLTVIDSNAALNNAPSLSNRYTDQGYASRTLDDVHHLSALETFTNKLKNGAQATAKGLYGSFAGGTLLLEQGVNAALAAPFELMSYAGTDNFGQYDIPGQIGGYLRSLSTSAAQQREDLKRVLGFSETSYAATKQGYLAQQAYGAGESIVQNLMTLPFALEQGLAAKTTTAAESVYTAFKGLLPMGITTAGQSYEEARAQGVDPATATLLGLSQGAIEMGTEAIPLGKLVRDVKVTAPLWKVLRNQLITENITEQAATALQDLNDWAILPENADKTIGDYLAERPSAALDTAIQTSIATLVQGTVMRAGAMSERRNMTKGQLAVQGETDLNDIITTIQETKSHKRNPADVKDLMDDIGAENIHIDARTAAQVLNQSQLQTLVSDQDLQTALQTQGDIVVPASQLAMAVASDESMRPIVEHARVNPDLPSAAEAREVESKRQEMIKQQGQVSAESEKILADAQTEKAFIDSANQVSATLTEQLKAVGKFLPGEISAYVAPIKAFYVTQAKQMNITPGELYSRLPYNVRAGKVEQAGAYNQITASLIYHGTSESAAAAIEANGFDVSKSADGSIWFTSNPDIGEVAASQSGAIVKRAINESDLKLGGWKESDQYSTDQLIQMGYDGLKLEDNGEITYQIFNPDKLVLVANNLQQVTDQEKLMAIHNLSSENLAFADKIGGLSVPSIGVVTAEKGGIEGFGEITLIGQKDIADPTKEKVFSADAYTVRFPQPEWPKVKVAKADKLIAKLQEIGKRFQDRIDSSTWDLLVNKPNANAIVENWMRSNAIKALFLEEQGIKINPVEGKRYFSSWLTESQLKELRPLYDIVNEQQNTLPINERDTEEYRKLTATIKSMLEQQLTEKDIELSPVAKNNIKRISESAVNILYKDYNALNQPLPVDVNETANELNKKLVGHEIEFKNWVDNQVMSQFGDPYIKISGKKVPYTLENIVKVMTSKKVKGQEDTMTYGAGRVRAEASIEFSDIEEMRKAAQESIVDEEEYNKVKKETEDKLSEYRDEISNYYTETDWRGHIDTWGAMDASMRAIAKWSTSKNKTKSGLISALRSEKFNTSKIPSELIDKGITAGEALLNAPVPYFEAKPQRAVSLDEFVGAVIPSNASQQTKNILEKHGIKIKEYTEGKRTETIRAFSQQLNLEQPGVLFQQSRGEFYPATLTTFLNFLQGKQRPDMSTFLHETGHFYLEAMFRMAAMPEATESMKAQAQTVLDWFGVQDLAAWNSMTLDEQRKHHEAWAYNYELYLYEGKAPSTEMQSIFDKFSVWLKELYQSIRGQLNAAYRQENGEDLPILTGEVRQVMDRLIASDTQISQAEEIRNMKAIFQTQEESGMDDQQWAEYQDLQTQSHESSVSDLTKSTLRQMKWLSNARSKLLKAMQSKVDDIRKGIHAEVTKEVQAQPVYRAIRFLRTGKLEDENGNPIQVQAGNKLNKGMVKSMYPEGALVPGPDMGKLRGMLSDEGLPPDMVAEIFGFTSGDDMVRSIAEAKSLKDAIDDETDARMLREHSELMDPEVQARNVEQALHTEARARFVAVELRHLAKATQPVRVMLQAAKQAAKQIISGKKIKDIKPRDYSLAEARAAKKAEAHLKKGESKQAAQEKQGQLLQGQLAAEAVDARNEVDAALSGFKKLFRADDRISKTRDMDLVNAARAILSAFGIGPKGKSPFDFVDQLRAYNPDLYAELEPLMFKAAEGAVDYKQLTMEEFRAMKDAVDALWFNAKRDKQIMVEGQKVELANVISELNDRMTQIGIPADVAGERKAPTKKDRLVRAFNNTKAILRRVEHWADSLDGEAGPGAFTKYIWRPVKDALNAYRLSRNDYVKRYAEMIQGLDLPVHIIEAPELDYSFGHGNGGIGKAELLGAILHIGNESNYKKLLVGRGWGVVREDGSLDTGRWDAFMARMINEGYLTKKDFDFAQQVWDLNEEIKPMAQQAHHDMFGYYFKEVPNTPFSNKFGSYRGGYVPAKTDPFIVRDAQRQSKMEALESDFRNAMPSTGLGFTKGRVEYNRPLSLDVRQMTNHIDSVIRFAMVQPAIKDALKILRNRKFADNLSRLDPSAIEDMLIPWLNRAARQITSEVGKSKFMDDIWRGIRQRTGIAIMFGNLRNALQQLTGYFPSALKVKPRYLKSALAAYISNTQSVTEDVAELSPFMKDRLQNQIFDIQENMNDILLNPSKFDKLKKWTQQHGYFLQTAFQNQVDVVTWTATYNQTLAELGSDISDEKARKEAVQRADAAVRLTQSSLSAEDLAAFEVGTPFTKTLTHFGGYMNMMANLNVTAFTKIVRDLGWRGNKGKLLYVYLLGIALPALVGDAIMRSLGTGWDDDDEDGYLDEFMAWFFGSQGKMVTGMVPFAGQLTTATYGALTTQQYDDKISISPSITALESAGGTIKAGLNLASEDKQLTGKNVRDVMTFLSLVTGVPMTILGRPLGYAVEVNRGEIQPTSAYDLTRGLVTGVPSAASKQ